MRKLFTGILLAAALPAFASITSDVNEGSKPADVIISEAIAACGGSAACQELAIEEALAAGIDLNSVISAAIANGVDQKTVQDAAIEAGQDPTAVLSAIASAVTTTNPTAGGPTQGSVFTPSGDSAPGQTTTTGISQAN
jgi:hypothetical protein